MDSPDAILMTAVGAAAARTAHGAPLSLPGQHRMRHRAHFSVHWRLRWPGLPQLWHGPVVAAALAEKKEVSAALAE